MICSKCSSDKSADCFKARTGRQCNDCVKHWHSVHYQNPQVKARHREQGRRWRAANKDRAHEMELKSRLKNKYNISIEEYKDLLLKQKGVCSICLSSDPKRKGARGLFVDHNHNTGRVRGLICHRCNLAIGLIEEEPSRLTEIAKYLKLNKLLVA